MADENKYTPIIKGIEEGMQISFVLFVLVFAVCMIILYFGA